MAPSNPPLITLAPPESSPRRRSTRRDSPSSCFTDTRSYPEVGGESGFPSPSGRCGEALSAGNHRKSAFARSCTNLSDDILPVPYGQDSKMKRVLMTRNANSHKRLEMELHKLSVEQAKRAEELTVQKLNFLENAFKKSVAVVEGLQKDCEALGRRRTTSGQELPSLSPARCSLISSRCSTATTRSSVGSRADGSSGGRTGSASPGVKFPGIAYASGATPERSPGPVRANQIFSHNRWLLKRGESMHRLVEHNMVEAIRHVSDQLPASLAERDPSDTAADGPSTWSCVEDERFIRLQSLLVPMWRKTTWEERGKPSENENTSLYSTGTGGPKKDNLAQKKRIRTDAFGIKMSKH